ELMSAPVVTVTPEETVAEAARIMHRRAVKRLPVLDGRGNLVGIVSRRDLLRIFLRDDDEIWREVIADVIERTLWLPRAGVGVAVDGGVVTLRGNLERKSLCGL